MKEIRLTKGKVTLVDDEDYEYLNQWHWYASKGKRTYYAARKITVNGVSKTINMHRLILNTPDNVLTDHINHNGLDNQKANLRFCTNGQNAMNRSPRGSSRYLGVYFMYEIRRGVEYRYISAGIGVNKKHVYLGRFKTEVEAALAYNEAAKKYHGEFANLNII